MTVQEAADYLGVSTDTIYNMVREKQIPHIRVRRRIFFRIDTLDIWLKEMEESTFHFHTNKIGK